MDYSSSQATSPSEGFSLLLEGVTHLVIIPAHGKGPRRSWEAEAVGWVAVPVVAQPGGAWQLRATAWTQRGPSGHAQPHRFPLRRPRDILGFGCCPASLLQLGLGAPGTDCPQFWERGSRLGAAACPRTPVTAGSSAVWSHRPFVGQGSVARLRRPGLPNPPRLSAHLLSGAGAVGSRDRLRGRGCAVRNGVLDAPADGQVFNPRSACRQSGALGSFLPPHPASGRRTGRAHMRGRGTLQGWADPPRHMSTFEANSVKTLRSSS